MWRLLGNIFAFAAFLIALPTDLHAQAKGAGRPLPICIARAVPGQDWRSVLSRPTGFDCADDQTHFGPGDYWAITPPIDLRGDRENPLRIRMASLWQTGMTLHALHADGSVRSFPTSDTRLSSRLQLGAIIEFGFPAHAAPVTRLLWRVEDSANLRGVALGVRASDASESVRANLTMAAIYAGFLGLCVALLIYNLALWGALRHRFQLAYCAMVAALLVYTLSSSGALAWLWPDFSNNDRLRINYMTLAAAAAAALYFARTFFEERVFSPLLARMVTGVSLLVLAGGAAVMLAPIAWAPVADRFYSVAFLTVPMAVMPILWRAWALRSSYLWLFAIAWAAPIGMAVVRALHNVGLVGWSFWLDNSTILAMAVEALLSSLAIAYRIRLLSEERDLAIAQELSTRLLADTDSLTGLLNRRAFLQQVTGTPGDKLLILADIDHFKRVNDTIGHDGGDEVLRIVARTLRAAVPAEAMVARIGGEEFAVVADRATGLDPQAILMALRSTRMPCDLRVTASLGICQGRLASEADWKALYRCADRALFVAKAEGRDRARYAEPLAVAA